MQDERATHYKNIYLEKIKVYELAARPVMKLLLDCRSITNRTLDNQTKTSG